MSTSTAASPEPRQSEPPPGGERRWRSWWPLAAVVAGALVVAGAPQTGWRLLALAGALAGAFATGSRRKGTQGLVAHPPLGGSEAAHSEHPPAAPAPASPVPSAPHPQSIGEFDFAVCHDLKEPLNKIAGFAGLLEKRHSGKLSEDADDYLHFMVAACQRMQQRLDDLLAVARIDSGAQRLERLRPASLVEQVVAELAAELAGAQAQLTVAPEMPDVQGDRVQLAELFKQLIDNAIRFRGKEPLTLAIEASESDGTVEFAVTDNGRGVPPEHQEAIFGIFQRQPATADAKHSGIGLAICRRVVNRHGGAIWVEANPTGGSTFRFTLPSTASAAKPDVAA